MKQFWKTGSLADRDTLDRIGSPVREPDDPAFAANGADTREREALENALIVDYDDGRTLAYRSEAERVHVEYRAGLIPA